jgi:hypothetical protein
MIHQKELPQKAAKKGLGRLTDMGQNYLLEAPAVIRL